MDRELYGVVGTLLDPAASTSEAMIGSMGSAPLGSSALRKTLDGAADVVLMAGCDRVRIGDVTGGQ